MIRRFPASALVAMLLAASPAAHDAQPSPGPYARIAVLRPRDGRTVEFEAGYIRHLDWHRQARDPWAWYGWTIWAGERQRWFVYATFGHAAANFDAPVAPADDERDNVLNVVPHAEFVGNALYEFLPALSRGTGVPQPVARMELVTVHLEPGTESAFETAVAARRGTLAGETLWFRLLAGGDAPQYVRLRPRASPSTLIAERDDLALPESVAARIVSKRVEILALRPTMSLGLQQP